MKKYHRTSKRPGRFARILIIPITIITLTLFNPRPVGAAFIFRYRQHAAQRTGALDRIFHHQYLQRQFIKHVILRNPLHIQTGPRYRNYGHGEDDTTFPIISSVSALVGLICICMALVTTYPVFLVVGIVGAILAIIFGAMGLKKKMKGFAIAGLALGILEVLAVIAGIIIVALAVLSLSSC